MKISKTAGILLGIVLAVFSLGAYLYWGNTSIVTTHYRFEHSAVPDSFDGFKIVQVSDLHNTYFDGKLTERIKEEKPDVIVVTGDIIDRNRTNISVAAEFLERITPLAPVYFVSGNHEVASGVYETLQQELDRLGVHNLDDDFTVLEQNGDRLGLVGLADPLMIQEDDLIEDEYGTSDHVIQTALEELAAEANTDFTMLLSHRPERFELYTQTDVDLAFTGHAHGGQIRLPFIGGLYAPTQGIFPEYTEGFYEENGTSMIVSRGLGNSIFPLRVFNRPELVVVTLESK